MGKACDYDTEVERLSGSIVVFARKFRCSSEEKVVINLEFRLLEFVSSFDISISDLSHRNLAKGSLILRFNFENLRVDTFFANYESSCRLNQPLGFNHIFYFVND